MSDLFTATTASEVEECLARGDNLEEERFIVRRGTETPLINSIKRGNKEVFLSLLQNGANPHHNPSGSLKPIQLAAWEGWKDMVEALIKAGADVNENEDGWRKGTPLFLAAENGAVDVTEGLLALGADTEIKDSEGKTPLMKACEKGHEDVVDRLLAAGAIANSTNKNGVTPLHRAAEYGHLGIVDRLVIYGADINQQSNHGWTALSVACYSGNHASVADRLVGLGCDLNLQNIHGKTPLMYACKQGRIEVVKILLAHGADTQITDNEGKKAIDLTRSQEIKDLLQGDLLAFIFFFFFQKPSINQSSETDHMILK